ncbi:hypothetical protein ACFXJ8_41845 [Nonomuraea sp. NPDC059194]|uniref:hypothetical protein n=1 Tax=Nonomuraea sp. NPDC059194 TaxID=3346764 RepID=UPI0036A821A4
MSMRYLLLGLEIAGALGLLVGISFQPLGIAAATGVGALGAHLRAGDVKGAPPVPGRRAIRWLEPSAVRPPAPGL